MNATNNYQSPINGTHCPDAIAMLTTEHSKIKELFKRFEKLSGKDGVAEKKQSLVLHACSALNIHMAIEEEIFYPAVRHVIDDEDLMDDAEIEHAAIKELIARIDVMPLDDNHYDATMTALAEQVARHIKEEETELFPAAKDSAINIEALGIKMLERRAELMSEMGLPREREEAIAPAGGKTTNTRPAVSKSGLY